METSKFPMSAKSIQRYAWFLGGITAVGALVVVLVWALGLMSPAERFFMTATVACNALLVWVLLAWARQVARNEGLEGARTPD